MTVQGPSPFYLPKFAWGWWLVEMGVIAVFLYLDVAMPTTQPSPWPPRTAVDAGYLWVWWTAFFGLVHACAARWRWQREVQGITCDGEEED